MSKILSNETTNDTVYLPKDRSSPQIHETATVRNSEITGNVVIKNNSHVVNAVLRADEGTPFYIGKGSNIQDFCVLHGYVVRDGENTIEGNLVKVNGNYYSIYIGDSVTVAHGALVHGPAFIGDNTFLGFKSTIDAATIGKNVEIGAHAYIKKVNIPDNTAIEPGAIITNEEDIEKYLTEPIGINQKIVKVNVEMAKAYNEQNVYA